MEKRIIIFYLHKKFVTDLLHNLFPEQFREKESLPDCNLELVLSQGEETVKVYSYFGFTHSLLSNGFSEVYVDKALINEENERLIESLPSAPQIRIVSSRELENSL